VVRSQLGKLWPGVKPAGVRFPHFPPNLFIDITMKDDVPNHKINKNLIGEFKFRWYKVFENVVSDMEDIISDNNDISNVISSGSVSSN
jgi:hypothetical protein